MCSVLLPVFSKFADHNPSFNVPFPFTISFISLLMNIFPQVCISVCQQSSSASAEICDVIMISLFSCLFLHYFFLIISQDRGSRLAVGSSSISISGLKRKALCPVTLCLYPPESCPKIFIVYFSQPEFFHELFINLCIFSSDVFDNMK